MRGAALASHGFVVADHDCLLRAAGDHDVEQVLVRGEACGLWEAGNDPAVSACNGFDTSVDQRAC
eukprot:6590976-Heterocapsa_arctica.AAC.1